MNTNETQENGRNLEAIKWTVVAILLIIAVIYNQLYYNTALLLRFLVVMTLIFMAGGVALLTKRGKKAFLFSREVRAEIRKVIWPSYQEALHTTLIVVVVTFIMSLILWGLDGILVQVVALITGLRF